MARLDADLGIARAPDAYAPLAALDPALADVAADLLWALAWANEERDAAYAGIADAEITARLDDEGSPEGAALAARIDRARVQAAAAALARAVEDARPALGRWTTSLGRIPSTSVAPAAAPTIDLFPVLGIDPLGIPNVFPHDYALSIDLGGDDVYDNNAGGSYIARGPVGEPSTYGPELGGVFVGGEFEEADEFYGTSVAIDVAGDDVYGVYKSPSANGWDRQCTTAPVVRRVVVQGSGAGGIGILADLAGDDAYRAKTVAQGTGHVGGVGILFDAGGDDSFTAVRSAMGAGLLVGVGLFVDGDGDDTHVLAAPPGGIFNGPRARCDASERLAMGAGQSISFAGAGSFFDAAGADSYRAGSQALGVGDSLGVGIFLDAGGADDYHGFPGRADGRQLVSTPAGGAGVFRDI